MTTADLAPANSSRSPLSGAASSLLSAVGYDPAIVVLLPRSEARFFVFASLLSVAAALLAGVSLGYGGWLAAGAVVAVPVGLATSVFVLNLLRLHHAGSGYPLHLPLELIPAWRPAAAAVVVLFTLGLLITQPLVLLAQKPVLDKDVASRVADERAVRDAALRRPLAPGQPPVDPADVARLVVSDGLILRGRVAWDRHPLSSSLLSLLFASVIAGPALLRRTQARVLRRYESERWIIERMFVDDEWARAQDAITALLSPLPRFSGQLSSHYADPPYNTRPLVFGLDPAVVVDDRVKFVRNRHGEGPLPVLPGDELPPTPTPKPPSSSNPPSSSMAVLMAASSPAAPTSPSPSHPSLPTSPSSRCDTQS